VQCHAKFDSPRAKKYCSRSCRERTKTLKQKPDAKRRGPIAHIQPRDCKCCGESFKPRRALYGTYCSRECAFRDLAAIRHLAAKGESSAKCLVYFKACVHCGVTWTAKRKNAPVCSIECGLARSAAKAREWFSAKCGDKAARACRCCAGSFTPGYGDKRSMYCSARCALRASRQLACKNARKRALKYGAEYEPVNRIKVFHRDGWKCQICGKATPRSRIGTMAPNAPELDHRVPISKRGGHTYANVQCACRKCNIAKGNRSSVGQLPLFAA
jgi:5-methylcytosine-specific restriction endonuclease McrA